MSDTIECERCGEKVPAAYATRHICPHLEEMLDRVRYCERELAEARRRLMIAVAFVVKRVGGAQ